MMDDGYVRVLDFLLSLFELFVLFLDGGLILFVVGKGFVDDLMRFGVVWVLLNVWGGGKKWVRWVDGQRAGILKIFYGKFIF